MKCKACGRFVSGDWPFCGDACCHVWLTSKDRWLWVPGMGMFSDLEDDDPNMNHTTSSMHYAREAAEMELASEELTNDARSKS